MNIFKKTFLRLFPRSKTFKRRYEAAKQNRINVGWLTSQTQIDADIREGLVPVRARARDLEQNEAIAKKYIRLCRKNIPGAYGFALKMKVKYKDASGKTISDKEANDKITEAWIDWGKKENCDASGQNSFRSIQHLIAIHAMRDGEFLVRGVKKPSKYGFQLQVLDPEIIDETYNAKLENGNVVIMGIELDQWRRRVAFHIKKYRPEFAAYGLGYVQERERVSASEMYYDFDKSRAFQTRGMSEMSASMLRMWKIKEYESAVVSNATIAARRLGFLESKPEESPATFTGTDTDTDGNVVIDTEEGSFHQLPRGWHINMPDANFPNDQHEPFVKSEMRMAASGLDVSYMTLASDPGDANYSSARVALLDEKETWMMLQEWIIESFLEPVFAAWLEMAFLTGALRLDGRRIEPLADFDYYNKPLFVGRRWPWVDPEKDAQAIRLKLKMGLTSLVREAAQNGDDLEELFQEAQYANELAKQYGVTISLDDKKSADEKPTEEKSDGKNGKPTTKALQTIMEN